MSPAKCLVFRKHFVTLFNNLVRQTNIVLCNAPCVMGYERESDLVIADVDIGMMAGLFGEIGDVKHEGDGLWKLVKVEGSDQLALIEMPVGYGG